MLQFKPGCEATTIAYLTERVRTLETRCVQLGDDCHNLQTSRAELKRRLRRMVDLAVKLRERAVAAEQERNAACHQMALYHCTHFIAPPAEESLVAAAAKVVADNARLRGRIQRALEALQ